jgi:hypothetical protein
MKFFHAAVSATLWLALGNIAVPGRAHAQSDNEAMKRQIDSLQPFLCRNPRRA